METLTKQLPSAEEAALAKHSSQELSGYIETKMTTQQLSITDADGVAHAINMPVSALKLLVNVLTELGEGNTVKLVPIHAELTTQEGADLLNISRPTFVKMLDDGTIPFTKTGNRRKVRYTDVQLYKHQLENDRLNALSELSALDQAVGAGYE
ncbi:helix-turn-helix domain-containing protein [Pseudoteredinibacter isoporae]|uniref:helix-turn-helix domain-containing protein n=1 Tax=Pseudoteredinibacter isoporae TaxID=570281 RepID=UPI0031021913